MPGANGIKKRLLPQAYSLNDQLLISLTSTSDLMNKYLLYSLLFITTLTACSKKENTTVNDPNEMVETTAMLKKKGNFVNGPYGSVSGNASLFLKDGKYQLALNDFMSSNGPDLKVYLSKETMPVNFINLGSLKSVSGNHVYDIPAGAMAEEYTYALIYCKQFSHLFGTAELVK